MGVDSLSINLGGGTLLVVSGVWSPVNSENMAEVGGLMPDVNARLDVEASDAVNSTLVGKTATAKGQTFRISSVDIGEVLTNIYLASDVNILR